MILEMADLVEAPEGLEDLCAQIEKRKGEMMSRPRKVVDVRRWLRVRSDHAYMRVLKTTIRAYRGEIPAVAFVLGLSESGVYQAVRRFDLWDTLAEARWRPIKLGECLRCRENHCS